MTRADYANLIFDFFSPNLKILGTLDNPQRICQRWNHKENCRSESSRCQYLIDMVNYGQNHGLAFAFRNNPKMVCIMEGFRICVVCTKHYSLHNTDEELCVCLATEAVSFCASER